MTQRRMRKTRVGLVISDKMDKSITVQIDRLVKHPKYGKYIRKRNKLKAHDEENMAKAGSKVQIMETRPLSKTKSWRLVKILDEAKG